MICHQCGARLHMHYRYQKDVENNAITWRCSEGGAAHVTARDETMLENVLKNLLSILDQENEIPPANTTLETELADLTARKQRIYDAYESGNLDLATYSTRTREINTRIAALQNTAEQQNAKRMETQQRQAVIDSLRARRSDLPHYIRTGDQQDVNHTLRAVYTEICVEQDGTILKTSLKNGL
jgi:site-specific DNA recombinase